MSDNYTTKIFLFFIAVRRHLNSNKIGLQDFLASFKLTHSTNIARFQFARIVQRINADGCNFNPYDIFQEITHNGEVLSKQLFKKTMMTIPTYTIHKIQSPAQKMAKRNKTQGDNIQQIRRFLAKRGFEALVEYIGHQKQKPEQIFNDCDQDGSGDIDRSQFNKFLFASEIQEFKDKQTCRCLIAELFQKQKKDRIGKQQFFSLFKMQNSNKMIEAEGLQRKGASLHVAKVSIKKIKKAPIMSKQSYNLHNSNPEDFIRQSESSEPKLNQKFRIKKQQQKTKANIPSSSTILPPNNALPSLKAPALAYPNAIQYYRQGIPSSEMLSYIEQLQRLLTAKKIYDDKQNPKAQGKYKYANVIFQQKPYKLIAMSPQTMNRERGSLKIGKFIEADDIQQGSIGDCYYLSVISSIASKYPELLSDRLMMEVNPAHYYVVRLFFDGEWKTIKTDDKFAYDDETGVVYAKPDSQEIWTMLLQKCFAKVYGSYAAIDTGNATQAFFALTGAPSTFYDLTKDNSEEIKQIIEDSDKKGFIMGASGSNYMIQIGEAKLSELGLISGHAYSLLGIFDLGDEILVKLRNPWGNFAWTGDWAFSSQLWTPELRKKMDYQQQLDDASFFMNWQDFSQFYGQIQICKVNPTFTHTSLRMLNNSRKSNYIQMTVTVKGKYHLFICQQNQRKHAGTGYTLSDARIIILKKQQNGTLIFIGANSTVASLTCQFEGEFQKGTYLISAKVKWNKWNDHECFLTSYGVEKVSFNKLNRSIAPKFKNDMIKSFAANNKGKGEIRTFADFELPEAQHQLYFSLSEGIGFMKLQNNSKMNLGLEVNFTLKGMKIIKPRSYPVKFDAKPSTQDVIGFFISPQGYQFSYQQSITIS